MTEGVFNCLIDEKRTRAFGKAIANTVRPGDVVVDMGTGSGVLAMLAARAGAKRVYAVELDRNNIATLEAVFRANALSEKIILICGDVCKVDLPEPVDVILGEMIATALLEELQVPAMNNMLRFAKRSTRVVLSRYKTFVDLVHNRELHHGLYFPIVRYEYPDMPRLKSKPLSEKTLVSDVDFTTQVVDFKVAQRLQVEVNRTGWLNGLRLSSESVFWDVSTLGATYAYSYPIILPLASRSVQAGELIQVKLSYKLCGGMKTLRYEIV